MKWILLVFSLCLCSCSGQDSERAEKSLPALQIPSETAPALEESHEITSALEKLTEETSFESNPLDINDYLGLTLNKIDIQANEIVIDLFNQGSSSIKVSVPSGQYQGEVIVKTKSEVKVFYHREYYGLMMTSQWFYSLTELEDNSITHYKAKLDEYIDLHETTSLLAFISANNNSSTLIKLQASNKHMVHPSFNIPRTHSDRLLTSGWQNHVVSPE
ncbi:MAG: hypothetical protein COA78_13315 [Blastopirellula sp.]|nr:MAG: hypothetical protein COA78_13315 [Blastopirellula sp.]